MNYEILTIETTKRLAMLDIENARLKKQLEIEKEKNEILNGDLCNIAQELGIPEGGYVEDILYEIRELKEKVC